MPPERALRRLASELRTCRVRGDRTLLVITGRGYGNRLQKPILRGRVEAWLEGAEARALGALAWTRTAKGGALEVRLAHPDDARHSG
jgi:DNA-nicking Smr family endonuclease